MPTPSTLSLPEWRAAASAAFGTLRVNADDPAAFRADLRVASAGEVSLFDMTTPAHTVERLAESIPGGRTPYCKLSLQLAGESSLTQDGRSCVLRPGDLALYVTQRPYRLVYPGPQHTMVVHFPQSFVHLTPDKISRLTAIRISGDEGLGRVAVPLFEQLAMNFEVLHGPHAGSLLRSSLDMLVTVLSSEPDRGEKTPATNMLFRRAVAHIDNHLGEMDLGPRSVAESLFVSVRHLHTQFAASGLTVGSYIRGRRLELIRRDLADPRRAGEPIQAIGARHGLPDASHVSRLFRTEFGESPSAYRSRALGVG